MDSASLVRNGITYITAKAAAPVVGISADYITKLCRKGDVDAFLVGNTWYVDQASVAAFVAHKETAKKEHAARNAQQIREATRRVEEIAQAEIKKTRVSQHPRLARTNPAYAFSVATIVLLVAMSAGTFAFSSHNQQSQLLAAAAATLPAPIQNSIDRTATAVFDFFCPFFSACDAESAVASAPRTLTAQRPLPVSATPTPEQSVQPPQPTIIERILEKTETIVQAASAGITEQLLDARLAALEASFSGRIDRLAYQGDRQAENLADNFADGIGGGFDDIDIADSTFTGGSISGASLSGITFSGETDFASLTATAATSTNATSTNLYVSGAFGFGSDTGLLRNDTGIVSTLSNGSNGQVLKIVGGNLQWSTDLTGGGGGGASFFASTTDDLAIYPADLTDVLLIGDSATTTTGNILEASGNSLFRGTATTYGLLSAPRFTATSSTASVFPYASTTALGATTLCLSSDCRTSWPVDTSFSTSSADYWKSISNFFSTTSADYWETQQAPRGIGFSTTSANYWQTTRDFFSTSSASYFASIGLAFSTTSADAWKSERNFFSTSSSDYWKSVTDLFSTTSAIYFAHSSTTIPKLYSSNIWSGNNSFSTLTLGSLNGPLHANAGAISATTSIGVLYGGTGLTTAPTYGQVLVGNSSGGYTLIATSSLGISESGTATTMLSGLPDAITCTNGATTYVLLLTVNSSGAPQYHVPFSSVVSGQYRVNYTSAGAYSSHTNMAGFDCVTSAKSLATLYDDGQAFNFLGDGSLFTNAASTYLTATSKNLAIGTSTAYSKLTVWGASSGNIFEAVTSASTTALSIAATGNLGVGTTTPTSILNIESVTPAFTINRSGSGTGNALMTFRQDNIVRGYVGISGASNGIITGDVSGDLAIRAETGALHFSTGGATDRMMISAAGNVGIATTSPWRTFSVVGSMSVSGLTLNTGAASASLCLSSSNEVTRNTDNESCITSSARYKHAIQSLIGTTTLKTLLALRPVSFEYNETRGVRYGLIAEEVDAIDPTLVGYDDQGEPNSVRYTSVIPLLIQAVQDIANVTGRFKENLVAFLADTQNGVTDLFATNLYATNVAADRITANQELCVGAGPADPSPVCVTKSQFIAVFGQTAGAAATISVPPPAANNDNSPIQNPSSTPATTTPEARQPDGSSATPSPSQAEDYLTESAQPPHEDSSSEQQSDEQTEQASLGTSTDDQLPPAANDNPLPSQADAI